MAINFPLQRHWRERVLERPSLSICPTAFFVMNFLAVPLLRTQTWKSHSKILTMKCVVISWENTNIAFWIYFLPNKSNFSFMNMKTDVTCASLWMGYKRLEILQKLYREILPGGELGFFLLFFFSILTKRSSFGLQVMA